MYLSPLCSKCKLSLFNGRHDTVRASGSSSSPAGFLMTSAVITLLLLLTPALKNNIYPGCHHHVVGGCVCVSLCLRQTLLMTSIPPFISSIILQQEWTQAVCVKHLFLRKSESREPDASAELKPPCSLIIFQLGAT